MASPTPIHADYVTANSIAIPAHQAGDLVLAYTRRNSGVSGMPSGWEEVAQVVGGNIGGRLMKLSSTDGSAIASVTFSAASNILLLIFRGYDIGASAAQATSSEPVVHIPGMELENNDGSSFVLIYANRTATDNWAGFTPASGDIDVERPEELSVGLVRITTEGVTDWPGGYYYYDTSDNRSGYAIVAELKDLSSAPTGPSLSDGTATDITASGVTLGATTNTGEGDAWYVIVSRNATQPSASQIKAGADANDDPAVASGTREIDATGPFLFDPAEGLAPATLYDAYIYQEDGEAEGSNILKVQFETLANTIQWSVEPAVDEVGVGSVTIKATPDRACEVHAIALAVGATDVTLASSVCEGQDGDGEPAAAHDYDTSDGSEVTLTLTGLTDPVYNIRVAARIPDPEE